MEERTTDAKMDIFFIPDLNISSTQGTNPLALPCFSVLWNQENRALAEQQDLEYRAWEDADVVWWCLLLF